MMADELTPTTVFSLPETTQEYGPCMGCGQQVFSVWPPLSSSVEPGRSNAGIGIVTPTLRVVFCTDCTAIAAALMAKAVQEQRARQQMDDAYNRARQLKEEEAARHGGF